MSLAARALETAGIATVIVGSARDIVEECGVARFVFSDVPLGNPFGSPADVETQQDTLALAIELVELASRPRTTVQSSATWSGDEWRENYMRVDDATREAMAAAGAKRRERQIVTRAERVGR